MSSIIQFSRENYHTNTAPSIYNLIDLNCILLLPTLILFFPSKKVLNLGSQLSRNNIKHALGFRISYVDIGAMLQQHLKYLASI